MHSLTISTQFYQQQLSLVIFIRITIAIANDLCMYVFAEVVVVANTIILCVTVSFHFVLNQIHAYSSSSSRFTKTVYAFGMR